MAQVFRRDKNPEERFLLKLQELDPRATYKLEDLSSDWKGRILRPSADGRWSLDPASQGVFGCFDYLRERELNSA